MKNTILIRIITTLLGWAVAFVIAYLMLLMFGHELETMPPAITALIFSGVLVTVMGNFVMPYISKMVMQFFKKGV